MIIQLIKLINSGASFNYMYHDFTREEVNTKNTLNSNLTLIEDYDRIRTETQDEKEFEASLNYQHNFPEEDHVLKAEFKYSYSPELENNKYTNNFRIPNQVTSFEKTTIYQTGLLKNIEIEYSNPLTETANLRLDTRENLIHLNSVTKGSIIQIL